MKSGIYIIYNKISGKYYVGSSKNIASRLNEHRYDLELNIHKNQHLQNSYNHYGKHAFVFQPMEFVEVSKLLEVEQKYMDMLKSANLPLYNISPTAGSNLGVKQNLSSEMRAKKTRLAKQNPAFSSFGTYSRMVDNWENDRGKWLKLTAKNIKKAIEKSKKSFIVVHPDGTEEEIYGLREFCRDNKIPYNKAKLILNNRRNPPNSCRINRKRTFYYNGYTFYDVDI